MDNKDKKYTVYVHTLKSDERKYFGVTSRSLSDRFGKDGNGYKQSIHFYRAIHKYGWENFTHEVVAENLTKDEAAQLEKTLIAEYDTCNPTKGFNIESGGFKNGKRMPYRDHPLKGRKQTEENIEKNRLGHIGTHPNVSDEVRKYRSEVLKRVRFDESKPVINLDTGIIYKSMTEAKRATGRTLNTIKYSIFHPEANTMSHWAFA